MRRSTPWFAMWCGTIFVIGAIALRVSHYRAMVDTITRDLDVQLWSRLAALKAEERVAPETLLDLQAQADRIFLNDLDSPESLVNAAYESWVLDEDLATIRSQSSLTDEIVVGGDGVISDLPLS